MTEKIYFTKDEAIAEIKSMHEILENHRPGHYGNLDDKLKEYTEQGFNCIYHFCETEYGWVANMEDCCPHCVHVCIKNHGSKDDKIKFNRVNDMGKKIPITNLEVAISRKKARKSYRRKYKSLRKKHLRSNYVSRETLEDILQRMRINNIPVSRVGKQNLYKNLMGIFFKGMNGFGKYVYVKDSGFNQSSYRTVTQNKILEVVQDRIKKTNKSKGMNVPIPQSIDEIKII